VTEKRILDAATKLFLQKGYERTTISDIVEELGDLTRGAVYHHFKSKEDIVDAVSTRISMQYSPLEKVKGENISGLDKIKALLAQSTAFVLPEDQLKLTLELIPLMQNPKFLVKSIQENIDQSVILEQIIKEGNADGSLSVPYPKYTAELLLLLCNLWLFFDINELSEAEFSGKTRFIQSLFAGIKLPVFDDVIIEKLIGLYKKLLYRDR